MINKTIILAGGSGFLGQSAADFFKASGYKIIIFTRGQTIEKNNIQYVNWDGKTLGNWCDYLENSTALINLTGRSINCIHNEQNKKDIIESRINSVKILNEALAKAKNPPSVFIQASSLAIYGNTTELCDENAIHAKDFPAEVCQKWENEFYKRELTQTRKVIFRIGLILGKNGGALKPLAKLTKLGLGGSIGSGKQFMSWLHIEDFNRMLEFAIENPNISGNYNITSLKPATNQEFMQTLRKVLKMPWSPPVPEFMVKVGARFIMKTEPNLALGSQNCIPKRFLESGFKIKYTNLTETLSDLLKK